MTKTITSLFLALVIGGAPVAAAPQSAPAPAVDTVQELALRGYDAIAYFTEGRPVRGSAEHTAEWNGATWRFASAEAMRKFAADPAAYAPQFGGYCAWAVSQGYIATGDPEQWKIVDGKLYLNFNVRAKALWEADQEDAIRRANANWPGVLHNNQNSGG